MPRLFEWATAGTIGVVLVVFLFMVGDHRNPDGEPFELFTGVSV